MERLSMPVEFVGGLRVSDAETVEIAKMVLIGKVNKDIVGRINRHGQSAVGSPVRTASSSESRGSPRPEERTSASSGTIEKVDTGVLNHIAQDYIPVIASVGADRDGLSHNVNADEAAGAVARALRRLQGHVPHRRRGWLRDPATRGPWLAKGPADEVGGAPAEISGGLRPKLQRAWRRSHGGVTFAPSSTAGSRHSLLL
jgi:acetylglutamate kinase